MNRNTTEMLRRLMSTLQSGLPPSVGATAYNATWDDALALRRISMTLHRWHELECGTDHGCIERDEKTGKPHWYNPNAPVHMVRVVSIPDREAGALKRLAKIMARYPSLSYYVQTDPRGAALYILRPGDVPAGADVSSYYSRGVAVFK